MQHSNKSEEQIYELMKEDRDKYVGTFSAFVAGKKFLDKVKNVLFHTAENDHFIIGSDDDNTNAVAFCVQQSLIKEGPHNVKWYEGELAWSVRVDGVSYFIQQGQANVTFVQRGDYRYGVSGDIDFVLPDGRKITGDFDIKLRE